MSLKERYTAPQPPAPRRQLSCTELLIALGCGGLLILACGGFVVGGLQGAIKTVLEGSQRSSENLNCKEIATAIVRYESAHKQFPPAYTLDADGNKLHSWRTLILPFLNQTDLYNKIDLTKPWNAPENAAAYATEVPAFKSSSNKLPAGQTLIRAVVDPTGVFIGDQSTHLSNIKDGTTKTLLFVQAGTNQSTHWMAPEDYSLKDLQSIDEKNAPYRHGTTHIAYADGSIGNLEIADLKPEDLARLVNIDDKATATKP